MQLNKYKTATNIFDINDKKIKFKMFHERALRTMILITMVVVGIDQKPVAQATLEDPADTGT